MLTLSAAWAALTLGGIIAHLFADWFLQNEWMAVNKVKWRHPAGYVHAGIHAAVLLLVFPVWAALIVGVLHFLIDLRSPLTWWGKFTRQTRPGPPVFWQSAGMGHDVRMGEKVEGHMLMDIGMEVAFWRDQVAHFVVIALVAAIV